MAQRLTLSSTDAANVSKLAPYIGSFWTQRFGDQLKLRVLLDLASKTKLSSDLESALANLAGDSATARLERYVTIPFSDSDVIKSGEIDYDDFRKDYSYTPGTVENFAFSVSNMDYFALPLTSHIPRSIYSPFGTQILGLDFYVVGAWLMFRRDPTQLFPKGAMRAILAERIDYNPKMTYLWRADCPENGKYLTRYYRGIRTPQSFQLALAAVAGLQICHYDQKLIHARQQLGTTVYTFENETLRVNYPHTRLVPGKNYSADTIIGDTIQVSYNRTGAKNAWWKSAGLGVGFVLDPVLRQFSGVALLDRLVPAYAATSDSGSVGGSKQHVRIQLTSDVLSETKYWDWVAARETRTGRYLNALIKLPELSGYAALMENYREAQVLNRSLGIPIEQPDVASLPGVKLVNPMDTFFEAGMEQRALIIIVNHDQILDLPAFYHFLTREMLTGVVPIVIGKSASLEVETAQDACTINIVEGDLAFTSTHYLSVTDTIDLNEEMTDAVYQRPLLPIFL